MKKRTALDLGVPILLLLAITVLIRAGHVDVPFSARYYAGDRLWKYEDPQPWKFLYDYGPLVSTVPGIIALGVFAAGFFRAGAAKHRRAAAFLVLSFSLGPGLVVNTIFKEHYGRPRPRDILRFDGDEQFREVWSPPVGNGHSFPSGHAATAFWLFSPWFLLRRKRPRAAAAFLLLGIGYGLLMGMARIGQGGHFVSDIVWAGGFTWFVSLALARGLGLEREEE